MYSFLRCSFLFFRANLEVKSGSRQKGARSGANNWDACKKDLEAPQREEKERGMECKNEREKAIFEQGLEEGRLQKKKEIAYHMHDKGYENWYIAAMLDESKQTIEQWIYDEDREAGMQLLAQVVLMLLEEERYEDLKKLGDEQFRDRAIEEYEKKKEQEKTGTSEPR